MCVVENSGKFGGTFAAPITGLMIEKYLNDSIAGKERKDRVEKLSQMNLIPPRIYAAVRTQDSLMHRKDSAYLMAKGYIKLMKDTLGIEEEDAKDDLEKLDTSKRLNNNLPPMPAGNDTGFIKQDAINPADRKKPSVKDSVNNDNK